MRYSFSITLRSKAFVVLIFCTVQSSLAQKNARDYFLPAAKNNKAIFSLPDTQEKKSAFTRVIYYLKNEDQYNVVDTTRYGTKLFRIEKRTVEFTSTEVRLVKLISTTDAEPNKITPYDPPKIILKVPGIGQSQAWSYQDEYGQKTNFIAEWIKFKLNNINTRAIRVTETIVLPNGLPFEAARISFYKEGIGLWKMEGETRQIKQTILEFTNLEYDSTKNYK
jgi:hypothetical protein